MYVIAAGLSVVYIVQYSVQQYSCVPHVLQSGGNLATAKTKNGEVETVRGMTS